MKRPSTKAKAIDLKKDKMIIGSLALLVGLMTMAFFSISAQAKTKIPQLWSSYSVGEGEMKFPLQLSSQKMGH